MLGELRTAPVVLEAEIHGDAAVVVVRDHLVPGTVAAVDERHGVDAAFIAEAAIEHHAHAAFETDPNAG